MDPKSTSVKPKLDSRPRGARLSLEAIQKRFTTNRFGQSTAANKKGGAALRIINEP